MKRNYGVDLLRMLAMFMVVVLHVLGQGGILGMSTQYSEVKYWIAWFMEITCYCAVNCFALISGYVMYRSTPKLSKAVNLWFQTAFYTLTFFIVFLLFKRESMGLGDALNAVFPVTRKHYWYISAYMGLLLLMPLLNAAIAHTQKRTLGFILAAGFVMFSIFPQLLMADPYILSGGYSLIWLILMYLTGAYLHKYGLFAKIRTRFIWFGILAMLLITFASRFLLEVFPQHIFPTAKFRDVLISYVSPTIVLVAVGLLIAFSRMRLPGWLTSAVCILSPAALGVYLIHTNQLVWRYVMLGFAWKMLEYNCFVMVLLIFLAATAIYLLCSIMEIGRLHLFRLIKADKFCAAVDRWAAKKLEKENIG